MKQVFLNTSSESILLPITPAEVGISSGVNIFKQGVIKVGEIPHFNGSKLRTVTISSFLPNQEYYFAFATKLKTYDLANKLTQWMYNNQPLRLIVTETGINMVVTIESFDIKEKDGTGDLYYDLSLLEYRDVNAPKVGDYYGSGGSGQSGTRTNDSKDIQDKNEVLKQVTYIVKKGDTLIDIAKMYYGNTKYQKIVEANKEKYPTLKSTTQINIGWELIIPQ